MELSCEATRELVFKAPREVCKSTPTWQASELLRLRSEVAQLRQATERANGELCKLRQLNGAFVERINLVDEIRSFADQRAAELIVLRDQYALAELRLAEMTNSNSTLSAHLAAEQARAEEISQDVLMKTEALAVHANERLFEQATWAAERSALLAEEHARLEVHVSERIKIEDFAQIQREDNVRLNAALRDAEQQIVDQRQRAVHAEGVLVQERASFTQGMSDIVQQLEEHRAEWAKAADSTQAQNAAIKAERDYWRNRYNEVTGSAIWRLSEPIRKLLAKPSQP